MLASERPTFLPSATTSVATLRRSESADLSRNSLPASPAPGIAFSIRSSLGVMVFSASAARVAKASTAACSLRLSPPTRSFSIEPRISLAPRVSPRFAASLATACSASRNALRAALAIKPRAASSPPRTAAPPPTTAASATLRSSHPSACLPGPPSRHSAQDRHDDFVDDRVDDAFGDLLEHRDLGERRAERRHRRRDRLGNLAREDHEVDDRVDLEAEHQARAREHRRADGLDARRGVPEHRQRRVVALELVVERVERVGLVVRHELLRSRRRQLMGLADRRTELAPGLADCEQILLIDLGPGEAQVVEQPLQFAGQCYAHTGALPVTLL